MPSSQGLPVVSGQQCIAALEKIGYSRVRQRGSLVRLTCEGRPPVTVPLHRELDRDTLRAILRVADVAVPEFILLIDWTGGRRTREKVKRSLSSQAPAVLVVRPQLHRVAVGIENP